MSFPPWGRGVPAKSVLRIPQRSLRILSLPKRRCSVYTTNRCAALAVAHRMYMTYSFLRNSWVLGFAPQSRLTSCSVFRQTASVDANRLSTFTPSRWRRVLCSLFFAAIVSFSEIGYLCPVKAQGGPNGQVGAVGPLSSPCPPGSSLITVLAENFDFVTPPVLPVGW